MENAESSVINLAKTTLYFKLERGTKKSDSTSAYLFIIALDVVFL